MESDDFTSSAPHHTLKYADGYPIHAFAIICLQNNAIFPKGKFVMKRGVQCEAFNPPLHQAFDFLEMRTSAPESFSPLEYVPYILFLAKCNGRRAVRSSPQDQIPVLFSLPLPITSINDEQHLKHPLTSPFPNTFRRSPLSSTLGPSSMMFLILFLCVKCACQLAIDVYCSQLDPPSPRATLLSDPSERVDPRWADCVRRETRSKTPCPLICSQAVLCHNPRIR